MWAKLPPIALTFGTTMYYYQENILFESNSETA